MAFTVTVNAARMNVATPVFDSSAPGGITLTIGYSLCTLQNGVWSDVVLGREDQSMPMHPTAIPGAADIASAIAADVQARFGGTVDVVQVNGQDYPATA